MKKMKDENEWFEISLELAIDYLSVYWQEDKIESMLLDEGLTLWTPHADYKAVLKEE